MKVSIRRASFAGMQDSTSKPLTSPAIRTRKSLASKRVMGPTPDFPATRLAQAVGTSMPTGLMTPRPVTTTRRRSLIQGKQDLGGRRRRASGLLQVGGDVLDRLLDGTDLLRFLVRDLALELVFQRHHQFDGVQRIGAEVLD